ncbi:MAG: phosphoenolpyruvate hydrolase family protein [Rhizobiaceae bacterium]
MSDENVSVPVLRHLTQAGASGGWSKLVTEFDLLLPFWPPLSPLPISVSGLSPNRNHNQDLVCALRELDESATGNCSCVGIFAADPFINLEAMSRLIKELGVHTVINFPTISQYGLHFLRQLDEVKHGVVSEVLTLARFKENGLSVGAAVCRKSDLLYWESIAPSFWLLCPEIEDFKQGHFNPSRMKKAFEEISAATDKTVYVLGDDNIIKTEI